MLRSVAVAVVFLAGCSKAEPKPKPYWCAYAKPGGAMSAHCVPQRAECENTLQTLGHFFDRCVEISPVFCHSNPLGPPLCRPTEAECMRSFASFRVEDRVQGRPERELTKSDCAAR